MLGWRGGDGVGIGRVRRFCPRVLVQIKVKALI